MPSAMAKLREQVRRNLFELKDFCLIFRAKDLAKNQTVVPYRYSLGYLIFKTVPSCKLRNGWPGLAYRQVQRTVANSVKALGLHRKIK